MRSDSVNTGLDARHRGPASDLDPFSDEFLTDPFPALDVLREAGPAVYLTSYGVWAVAGYRDAHAVLRDFGRFSSASGVGLANLLTDEYGWRKPSLILEADPPAHAAHRALMVSTMNPKAMRAFAELFDAEAAALADELVRRGRFDAVRDLAEIFPTVVFPRALGVQADTREALLAYGSLSFNAIGPRNRHLEAALKRAEGVLEWIAESCRREALRPGSIGLAIYEAADAEGMPEESAASLVRSMFSAGVDTTASGLGFAVHDFVRFPAQWELVRDDPSLARNAFEETIRFESPVTGFFRTTTTEVVLGESRIPAQSKVLVFFAGANRDPRQFPEPNTFDVRRRVAGHLGYGAGPHVCAGMNIARMEGEAIIRALADRVERWEPEGQPQFRLNNSLRGLASLPVRVVAR
jgi:4-methoxybenzoate monooxygenase (O-demethylating)